MQSTTSVNILQPTLTAVPAQQSRARQARRDLLERVTEFVMKHDLNVTGLNLATIGTALSGANTALAKAFVAREISRQPINQRWLDSVVRLDPESGDRMNELEAMMDRMELSLSRFAQTARDAVDTTNEHRGALGHEIKALTQIQPNGSPSVELERMLELSHTMFDRVCEVETAMAHSQAESDQLRASLAQARLEADIDHLTDMPNRRAFERRLTVMAEQAAIKDVPLCLAILDIDHFKAVNDTHGHEAGDRVLQAVAALLKRHSSERCFIARHGGEEFVLLLYGFDKDAAWRKLDGMRRQQAAKQLINRETNKSFGRVTFSGGLVGVEGEDDAQLALARADAALYDAKSGGRDKIVAG